MEKLRFSKFRYYCSVVLFLVFSIDALSSSCCGGGGDLPGVITGDLKRKFNISSSFANVVAYAGEDGKYYFSDSTWEKRKQILRLTYSQYFSEKWQLSFGLPYVKNIFESQAKSGVGDLSLGLGYTLAYEGFRWYKPQLIWFVSSNLPTGSSIYSSGNRDYYLDVMGNGTEVLFTGFSLTKSSALGLWTSQFALQQKFDHKKDGDAISYQPGVQWNLSLAKNFRSFNNWGWNLSYVFSLDGKKRVGTLEVSEVRSIGLGGGLSYQLKDGHSLGLNYSDQTLLGPAKNSNLQRSILFQYTNYEYL